MRHLLHAAYDRVKRHLSWARMGDQYESIENITFLYGISAAHVLPAGGQCDTLDHIDYEGSMIYDEYPDKWQIYRLTHMITDKIRNSGEGEPVEEDWNKTTEFVQILLCYEIYRRRHSNNNGILKF